MNRADRRRLKKQFKGTIVVNPGNEAIDRSKSTWCWMHKLNLENVDHPTERDKRIIETTRFKPFKRKDPKTNEIVYGRMCPRCGNTLMTEPDPLQLATETSILKVPEGKEYADV